MVLCKEKELLELVRFPSLIQRRKHTLSYLRFRLSRPSRRGRRLAIAWGTAALYLLGACRPEHYSVDMGLVGALRDLALLFVAPLLGGGRADGARISRGRALMPQTRLEAARGRRAISAFLSFAFAAMPAGVAAGHAGRLVAVPVCAIRSSRCARHCADGIRESKLQNDSLIADCVRGTAAALCDAHECAWGI